jgi:hypothetical protein
MYIRMHRCFFDSTVLAALPGLRLQYKTRRSSQILLALSEFETEPTRAGRWFGFDFDYRVPRGYEASSLWYASSTGPVGLTRVVVGFRRGGRDLFCGALCLRVRLTRVIRLCVARVSPEACRPDACRSMV